MKLGIRGTTRRITKHPLKLEKSLSPGSFKPTLVNKTAAIGRHEFPLNSGDTYLIRDDFERAYKVFSENMKSGSKGLIITREYPPKVREKFGLEKTRIIWLTSEMDNSQPTINNIQDISILISDFAQKTDRGVILLDGIEYLVTNHGFESTIHFLQSKRSQIEKTGNILITPILIEALQPQQAKLIERETKTLSPTPPSDNFRYI